MNRLKIILRDNHTLHEMMIGIVIVNLIPVIKDKKANKEETQS